QERASERETRRQLPVTEPTCLFLRSRGDILRAGEVGRGGQRVGERDFRIEVLQIVGREQSRGALEKIRRRLDVRPALTCTKSGSQQPPARSKCKLTAVVVKRAQLAEVRVRLLEV